MGRILAASIKKEFELIATNTANERSPGYHTTETKTAILVQFLLLRKEKV